MEDSGLEEALLQLSMHIENKRRQLEYLCRQHKVLLQPWPRNSKKEDEEIKNVSDVISEPKLTLEEQTGLDMVQRVLNKAEKARTVHKVTEVKRGKLETSEELGKNVNYLESTSFISENKTAGYDPVSNTIGENFTDLLKKPQEMTSTSESNINCASDIKAVSKTRETNNPPKSGKILQNSNTSNKRSLQPNASISKSVKNNKYCSEPVRVPTTFNADNNKISTRPHRPDSHTRSKQSTTELIRASRPRSSSAKTQYQAHLNAPFKTNPNIRVPSRAKCSVSKQQAGSVLKHSKPASLVGAVRHSSAPAIGTEKPQELKREVEANYDHRQQIACVESNSVSGVEENIFNIPKDSHDSVINSNETDKLTNQISALSVSKEAEIMAVGNESDVNKPFYLITDGSKLSIPKKLRRLYSNNCQLRQKYQALKITKKIGSGDVSADLMEKLENEFDAPSDLLIRKRLLSCLQSLKKLLDLLHKQNLTLITELSSPHEVLHAKMMTEFILTSFDSLQQECSELLAADMGSHFQDEVTEIFHSTVMPPFYWLPSNSSFGCEPPCCPANLLYEKSKDVCQFHHATFQLQFLQLRATLIQSVKTQFLPLLNSLDPKSCEFIQIFRAIYALLTSDGQHQPGLVGDTLDEELASAGFS